VYYFVIAADGARYGPADIDTLVQWVHEGRLIGSTVLVEYGTDKTLRADSLTAVAAALHRPAAPQAGVVIERSAAESPMAEIPPPVGPAGEPRRAAPPPPVPPIPEAKQVSVSPPFFPYATGGSVSSKSKVVAGLLGIFLGGLGIHRFYLGFTGVGLVMLLLSVAFGSVLLPFMVPGAGCGVIWIWGFIEGILCLCGKMRDAQGLPLRD